MTEPDSNNSQSKIVDILKPLIEGFSGQPALLAYGGLILITALVIYISGGGLPDILLVVPIIVVVAYLVEKLGMRWLELQDKKIGSQLSEERPVPTSEKPDPVPQDKRPDKVEDDSAQEWERRYLERVAARCELLPMEAIDKTATRPDAAKVALNRVFTQVDVARPLTEEETQQAVRRQREPEERREPAIAAIGRRQNNYLVLLGKPGSGKSTLVDYISLCLAGEELGRPGDPALAALEEQNWALGWLLPVRVILREYAERGLSKKQSLWQFITDELAKPDEEGQDLSAYVPHLERQLKRQGGLLLLDGLDEVPDAHRWRERLRREIRDLAAEFGRVRIVVTGRPYAYDKPEWQLPDFARTELLDFDEGQMFAYVDKRYQLMAGGETGLDQTQAAEYAEELKRQIKERQPLRELAARPLLLALITSLHHWRGGRTLPQDREKLYDESVDLLIDLWQRRKRLPEIDPNDETAHELTHLLGVGPVELRDALSQVAFEVHRDQPKPQGTANIPAAKLAGALYEVLDPRSKETTHQIIAYIQNRAGLLEEREALERGKEVYAFAHRTFQEYLAGCYLLTQDNFADEAARLARPDPERWREALLLAARRDKNPAPAWDLVDALCRPPDAPQPGDAVAGEAWWGAFLAGRVLMERELWLNPPPRRQPLVARVQAWLVALLDAGALPPRDRAAAGRMLAVLDDTRRGVGVIERDGLKLPDIWWGEEVPAGTYAYQQTKVPIPQPFRLSRYPITNSQFQCFVDALDWDEPAWWQGIPDDEKRFSNPRFPYANHPRETVSWYQAMAFCKWLEAKLHAGILPAEQLTGDLKQYEITLPHEYEWEVAARYPDSRSYPWGDEFDKEKANTNEGGIGQTTAVGLYPSGKNPALELYDLSGNVWEWCRNKYDDPDDDVVDESGKRRVLRGGSWVYGGSSARAADRDDDTPGDRDDSNGFRVAVVRRSPSHQEH